MVMFRLIDPDLETIIGEGFVNPDFVASVTDRPDIEVKTPEGIVPVSCVLYSSGKFDYVAGSARTIRLNLMFVP
jgi:hypothetical protein